MFLFKSLLSLWVVRVVGDVDGRVFGNIGFFETTDTMIGVVVVLKV